MIRTRVELIKNEKFEGKVYLDGTVEFEHIDTVDQFCDNLKDHMIDLIEYFRRTCHEANED